MLTKAIKQLFFNVEEKNKQICRFEFVAQTDRQTDTYTNR